MLHNITFASALIAVANSLQITAENRSIIEGQKKACYEMNPVVQDKINKLKRVAAIEVPLLPDWAVDVDGEPSSIPRCCTTLYDLGLIGGYEPEQKWYEGEIECGGDGTTIKPKGYGILFYT